MSTTKRPSIVVSSGLVRCCGTCKHWKNPKTPQTYRKRHCHHSGFYGGDIKNDSTADCKWELANV